MEKDNYLLNVKNLNIEFMDMDVQKQVVSGLNLTIKEGEIIGLVGESGSGKTLSALAIAGLLQKRKDVSMQGEISFADHRDFLSLQEKELCKVRGTEIGIIFQEPMTSLNPVKTIGWQVEESLSIHTSIKKEERKKRAITALEKVGLLDAERIYHAYPHELSGGQRQRVMIAAAMIHEPRLLIADEPTTALDVTIQAQIVDLLKEINKNTHTAILFISHDLNLVHGLCDRVYVMKDGRVVESGDSDTIFRMPKEAYTTALLHAIPKFEKDIKREADLSQNQKKADILQVSNLCVYFEKRRKSIFEKKEKVQILSDVSFSIKQGEIGGLVGESGSGKSTLARTLLGINSDYAGEVILADNYPQMIFQDPFSSLNPAKTVGWILEEPLRNITKDTKEVRKEKAKAMISKVGLSEKYLNRYPHELSGGQRQRVCIALSLMLNPKLLIADEAVSALDVTIQKQILDLLRALHREFNNAILFISHDLRVVYGFCDRVLVLKDGKIIEQGTVEEIYQNPKEDYTRQLLESAEYNRTKRM